MDGIAILVKEIYKKDLLCQDDLDHEEKRTIFVTENSVTRNEWFEAARNDMNASIVLETAFVNYMGEKIIEYNNKRYSIYRTFRRNDNDMIELYLEEKAGVLK